MKVDRVDKEIFQILRKKESTTTEMAREILSPEDRHDMKKGDNFIRTRMNKWEGLGVVKGKENNGRKTYGLFKDKVFIGDASVVINEEGQDAVLPVGPAILIKTKKEWALFEGNPKKKE